MTLEMSSHSPQSLKCILENPHIFARCSSTSFISESTLFFHRLPTYSTKGKAYFPSINSTLIHFDHQRGELQGIEFMETYFFLFWWRNGICQNWIINRVIPFICSKINSYFVIKNQKICRFNAALKSKFPRPLYPLDSSNQHRNSALRKNVFFFTSMPIEYPGLDLIFPRFR